MPGQPLSSQVTVLLVVQIGFTALTGLAQSAPPPRSDGAVPDTVETGRLIFHQLLRPVGEETYSLSFADDRYTLSSQFLHEDRGSRTEHDMEMRFRSDLTTESVSLRRDDRFEPVVTLTESGLATIRDGVSERSFPAPDRFVALDGYAPYSPQMMAIRYWLASGRPDSLPSLRRGYAKIQELGRDTVAGPTGERTGLTRYSVDGLTWGRQIIWLDEAHALVAAVTLTFPYEVVREGFEASLGVFVERARTEELTRWQRITRSATPEREGEFALVGARLIDGTGAPPVDDAVVVVRDGRIAAVGPRAEVVVPERAEVVELDGRSVLPGLWDMHTHVGGTPDVGPAYLATGVTSIRDLGGETDWLLAMRDAFDSGRIIGPRLFLAVEIDGAVPEAVGTIQAATAEEAVRLVRRYHGLGFDHVKIYQSLAPELVSVITRTADELGMTVTGHVPTGMTVLEAVEAGMDQVNHAFSMDNVLLPSQPSVFTPEWGEAWAQLDLGSPRIRDLVSRLSRAGVVVDPTLVLGEMFFRSRDTPVSSIYPESPPWLNEIGASPGLTPEASSIGQRVFQRYIELVGLLHDAGVAIVAGSDTRFFGYSIHREMELYVMAGMTPMEAILAATAVPARAMGVEDEVGTLQVGKRADLMIVDGDPTRSIAEIGTVYAVVAGGRMYRADELRAVLEGAR